MTALNADVINRTTLDFNLQRSQIPLPGISSAKKNNNNNNNDTCHLDVTVIWDCHVYLLSPRPVVLYYSLSVQIWRSHRIFVGALMFFFTTLWFVIFGMYNMSSSFSSQMFMYDL